MIFDALLAAIGGLLSQLAASIDFFFVELSAFLAALGL